MKKWIKRTKTKISIWKDDLCFAIALRKNWYSGYILNLKFFFGTIYDILLLILFILFFPIALPLAIIIDKWRISKLEKNSTIVDFVEINRGET